MAQVLKTLLWLTLCFSFSLPGFAQGAASPEAAPLQFFRALNEKKYGQAWQSLTRKSQSEIVGLVLKIEKDSGLEAAGVKKLFENNDITVQRGFWDTFRQNIGLELWLKQRFTVQKQLSATEALVSMTPNPVTLKVWKEEDGWKFGYVESFVSNAPIQSQNKKEGKTP